MIFDLLSCVGINHQKSDTSVRSRFALTKLQIEDLYQEDRLHPLLILSTCNRTEVYSLGTPIKELVDLLGGDDVDLFSQHYYTYSGEDCFQHLARVASGLDSQLLGDYEIAGQVKDAIKLAKRYKQLTGIFEKIINYSQSIAKKIRTQTNISTGSVSVSKSAVKFLLSNLTDLKNKSILVIGAGKMGRDTIKNILTELPSPNLTLINRTDTVAMNLATSLSINHNYYNNLIPQINEADIIIIATNAEDYLIYPNLIHNSKTIIDLSIPKNVHPKVGDIVGVTLIDVDELTKVKDETLKMRKLEINKAEDILLKQTVKFRKQLIESLKYKK